MRLTTITHPDGSVTTVATRTGCGGGCLTLLAILVVVGGPAAWFPPPLAVLAYVFEALLGLLAIVTWIGRRGREKA